MKIKNYVKPTSLEEAYQWNQKRSARLMGGMLWLRLGRGTIQTAIDLSGLGLEGIRETEESFYIGAMTALRSLEQHPGLEAYTEGSLRKAVSSIVGVQFRNLATVGGSIWGRFGFSDVLTVFLALDTWVELYKGGFVPLSEFVNRKKDNDILLGLRVKKRPQHTAYQSFRNTRTDFPVLTCAMSLQDEGRGIASVGARPGRAMTLELPEEWCRKLAELREAAGKAEEGAFVEGAEAQEKLLEFSQKDHWKKEAERLAEELAARIPTGSNMRAGAEYRTHLAKVLLGRCLEELMQKGEVRA